MKFRNPFKSKKDEKSLCINNHHQFNDTISATKKPPSILPVHRQFMDDMNLMKASAAYHTEVKPSYRKPLRSCPGGISKNDNFDDSDSDSEAPPPPQQHPRQIHFKAPRVPQSLYTGHHPRSRKFNNYRNETSEYGSGDHSPISNVLRDRYDNIFAQKYRKYKSLFRVEHEEKKELEKKIYHLEKGKDEDKKLIKELTNQVAQLQKQLHSYPPKYQQTFPYYHQPQGFAPPPPFSHLQPHHHTQNQMSFSTAPTLTIGGYQPEMDEIKNYRHQATPLGSPGKSQISLSSNSLSYGEFNKMNSNPRFSNLNLNERENLPPLPSSAMNNFSNEI